MFTSKKLLIAALFFSAIQSPVLANITDNDLRNELDNHLNKILINLNKQVEYVDEADKLLGTPQNPEKELVVKIGQLIREIKSIHKELVQQAKQVAAEEEIIIVNVVQNLEQIKNLKQQALRMFPLIVEHAASAERKLQLTEIIKKNLQEIQYLKELAYQLLGLTDSKAIKIQWLEENIIKLYREFGFATGFIAPFIATSFVASVYMLCLKIVVG